MKPKFKGFAFVPLLIVLFLLIISAVTSYVVINQGTGGYKTRAESTCSEFKCVRGLQGSNIVCTAASRTYCHVVRTGISGRFYDCVAKDEYSRVKYGTTAYHSCRAVTVSCNTIGCVCTGNAACASGNCASGRCMAAPTVCGGSGQRCCSVRGEGTTQYYCNSPYGCSAQSTAGVCRSVTTCGGGILCRNNQPIIGTVGQTVCGLGNVPYKCGANGAWAPGSAGSCTSTTLGYCSTSAPPPPTASDPLPPPPASDPLPDAPPAEQPPPATTGDATLAFTLKLQGVTGNPKGEKTVPFKVKLRGPSDTDYASGTLTVDSSGLWKGSVSFNGINTGEGYTVFVKAGKHFQKRVCDPVPTETSGGLYNCSSGATTISSGVNNSDFSGILMLVGDLPSASGVQSGTADAYDKTFVVNNFGSTASDKLQIGDLNFDGVIDTQDRSLITQSLNVKYDDE